MAPTGYRTPTDVGWRRCRRRSVVTDTETRIVVMHRRNAMGWCVFDGNTEVGGFDARYEQ